MVETNERELHAALESLPVSKQREVLEFARALNAKPTVGVPGSSYLPWKNPFDPADLSVMEKAIEEDCERIDTKLDSCNT